MRRMIAVVMIVVVAAAGFVGVRWYGYVSNSTSPYDEVGIELNSRMPDALNKWGCEKLHATFGDVVPPYGCAASGGQGWR